MTAACSYLEEGGLFEGTASVIMGTKLEVLLCSVREDDARRLWKEITDDLIRLDKVFNRFRPDSDVSAWNGGIRDGLDTSLIEAVDICNRYKERTSGVFDIGLSGRLDFGGFAKGYALGSINSILRKAGVSKAFINFGNSSILAIGSHPCGDGWKVALPDPWTGEPADEFRLRDTSLSVSGNSPHYIGHIINPLTGTADLSHRFSSVICNDPLEAEALSTAALASLPGQLEFLRSAFPDAEIRIYGH